MASKLGQNLTDYSDLPYKGFLSASSPNIVKEIEAVKNAIKLYLFSSVGDYGRNLTKGGPLFVYIGSILNEDVKGDIATSIEDALKVYEDLVVHEIDVIPDRINKKWKITITVSDNFNKLTTDVSLEIPAT